MSKLLNLSFPELAFLFVKCYCMISCLLKDSLQYLFVLYYISSSEEYVQITMYVISLVQAVGYVSEGSKHCFTKNIL